MPALGERMRQKLTNIFQRRKEKRVDPTTSAEEDGPIQLDTPSVLHSATPFDASNVQPSMLVPSASREKRPTASEDQTVFSGRAERTSVTIVLGVSPGQAPTATVPLSPPEAILCQQHRHNQQVPSPTTVEGTSFFAGANGLAIQNQHITTQTTNNTFNPGLSNPLFEYLKPFVVHGAAQDSNDRRDAPSCHEETRIAIREDIIGWIKYDGEENEPKRIMWLSGPAGGGKSAIAGSVAETCKQEGLLAATFFFSSFSPSMDRSWSRGLIATLVHHLSQNDVFHSYRGQLLRAIERRPDIFYKNLSEQAEHLILAPFQHILGQTDTDRSLWPRVIIVDGVDEVLAQPSPSPQIQGAQRAAEDDQVEVLNVLITLCRSPYFPFRIFVASRPEKHIADFFADAQPSPLALFLDSKYEPDADIERFLWSKFARIRRRSGISDASWPGEEAVKHIIDMSSGQFIVPTTVIRWIESGIPQQQLSEILHLAQDRITSKNPFANLDALYHHILTRARNPESDPHLVIKWIHSTRSGWTTLSAKFWRHMLEDVEGELDYRMAPILSLVFIPPFDDHSSSIEIYHKSLADYLASKARCGDLYVDKEEIGSFASERFSVVLENRGPRVPLPAKSLNTFLVDLFHMAAPPHHFPTQSANSGIAHFRYHLSPASMNALALCDVPWWVRRCLAQEFDHDEGLTFLLGMYFAAHCTMKCENDDLPPAQSCQSQERTVKCHPACAHWRTGILCEAKLLGWCVHEVEGVSLVELEDVRLGRAEAMFKRPGPSATVSYP